ncbi:hypothetical protein MAR_027733, partial [Mya arenaria]
MRNSYIVSCIKDLCRQKILHVIQSLENDRTLNITIELQVILRYLLQLSSLTCMRSCIVFVQEALQILEQTIQSLLLSQGLKVQELRVRQVVRECDPCGVLFRKVFLTSCRIQRRTYSVSGPQALWHIDGNHKLIRWRLVIHGGIDGYSRFPVYLNVSNNNRADTVLYAFLEAVQQFGLDKGGENVLVAEYMVEHQPIVNRPFIAGRSVHNQ